MPTAKKAKGKTEQSEEAIRPKMSRVSTDHKDIIAIFTADWHLSDKPPVSRSSEPDWLLAQSRALAELCELQTHYEVPIFVVGDIFHRWDSSPFLINWTLAQLKLFSHSIVTIPGNHDTPHHSHKELSRSAYWTLVEAGAIKNLTVGTDHAFATFCVNPFPFGFPIEPIKGDRGLALKVALCHDYIWTKHTGFSEADPGKRYASWLQKLKGYDVAFFGDNHNSFVISSDTKCSICNCGSLIRRNSNEKSYKPSVALLRANGEIKRHYLNTDQDKWLDLTAEIGKLESNLQIDLEEFADELDRLHNERIDFSVLVLTWLEKNRITGSVRDILLKAIGGSPCQPSRR